VLRNLIIRRDGAVTEASPLADDHSDEDEDEGLAGVSESQPMGDEAAAAASASSGADPILAAGCSDCQQRTSTR